MNTIDNIGNVSWQWFFFKLIENLYLTRTGKSDIILVIAYILMGVVLDKSIGDIADIFKAMGDSTRLKILKVLGTQGSSICVGFIAQTLNVSQPAVSQHLKTLKSAGLVEAIRQGNQVHYHVRYDALDMYGVNLDALLKTLGFELNLDGKCKFEGDKKRCNALKR